jgi:hypothetical protein
MVAYVAPVAAYAQSQSSTLSVLSNHLEATVPADARGSAEFPAAVGSKAVRSRGLGIEPDLVAYSVELNPDNTAALPDNSTVAFSTSRKQVGRR